MWEEEEEEEEEVQSVRGPNLSPCAATRMTLVAEPREGGAQWAPPRSRPWELASAIRLKGTELRAWVQKHEAREPCAAQPRLRST